VQGPRVAAILVDYNEGSFLEQSLPALAAQTRPPDRTILVVNLAEDGSVDMVRERFPHVEVIELDRPSGFAVANNVGIRAADDCDWVALLNPDVYAEPDWLETMLRSAAEHPEFAVFGSRLRRVHEPGLLDGTGDMFHVSGLTWRRDYLVPEAESPHVERAGEIFSASAAAAFYRRDAVMEVGGFDESFFIYWEDTDLVFRMRLAGHRVWYEPGAIVRHVGSGTTGTLSELSVYHSHRNNVWTWVRDMPLPLLVMYLPQHLLVNLLSLATFARQGHGRTLLRAKRDAILGLPRILRERREIQARRRVGTRELLRLMSRGMDARAAMPTLERLERVWRGRRARG
jgi:GT2 family glycosyltransferase